MNGFCGVDDIGKNPNPKPCGWFSEACAELVGTLDLGRGRVVWEPVGESGSKYSGRRFVGGGGSR